MSPRPPAQWWVRADGRAYGPFASERLPGFVREGRLTADTLVSRDAAGPWLAAGRDPSLDELLRPLRPAAADPPPPAPRPVARAPAPGAAPAAAPRPEPVPEPPRVGARAFLVFADLQAGTAEAFALALDALGATAPARPGAWLLRGEGDAAQVRNALSRALGAGGGLLVVRAEPAEVAWFNLDAEADRDLRRLWAAPADPPRPARAQPARPPATAPPSAGVAPASARAQPAARSSRA